MRQISRKAFMQLTDLARNSHRLSFAEGPMSAIADLCFTGVGG
jgi:hypothetical protein